MMSSRATVAISLLAMASVAHAQVSLPPPAENTEPRPLYAPWTGPGFGNPDAQHDSVGHARKSYNDASGTPAYSSGGNPEATDGNQKPRKSKNAKPNTTPKPAAPAGNEKQNER